MFDEAIEFIAPCEVPSSAIEPQSAVLLIEPSQREQFRKQLLRLNKKANTFGLPAIKVLKETQVLYERVSEHIGRSDAVISYLQPLKPGKHPAHPVRLLRLEIHYPEIKLGNWQVVGKLESMEGGNLQFHVTEGKADAQAIAAYAAKPTTCEHCNTNRRRKDVFILRDLDTQAYKQVGGSCLLDFTGIDPSRALFLAKMWEVFRAEEDELLDFLRSGRSNAVGTREFLADVSFLAQTQGFVSSTKAREIGIPATYDDAIGLTRQLERDTVLNGRYWKTREMHLAVADAIRDWAKQLPLENSFNANVQLLLQRDSIELNPKHLAFAAASWAAYSKALHLNEARAKSVHIGEPGQKLLRTLTFRRAIPLDSVYGVSYLILMKDEDGNAVTWKTRACPTWMLDADHEVRFNASFKVKQHDTYKGTCQTAVSHLKDLGEPVEKQ